MRSARDRGALPECQISTLKGFEKAPNKNSDCSVRNSKIGYDYTPGSEFSPAFVAADSTRTQCQTEGRAVSKKIR